MRETGSREGHQQPTTWRSKGGLETPLVGRVVGENKRLIFAPPLWYDGLVFVCVAGGVLCLLLSLVSPALFGENQHVAMFAAFAVMLAGVWGAFSNERIVCDLRARTYARLEGQGFGKRVTRGSLNELYAIVLMAQELPVPMQGVRPVIYRLVLYWKQAKEPLLVIGRDNRAIPYGTPLNAAAGAIAQFGYRNAQLLGIPFYDNSQVSSNGPLSVV